MKNNQTKTYRQGDVLVTSVEVLPAKTKKIARENGRIVLAHGKSTGHSHAIKDKNADLFSGAAPGEVYLVVGGVSAQLVHDEHSTIEIEPGNYRVVRQREFNPEEIRNVID